MINIRVYISPKDEEDVFKLYLETVGDSWPLTVQDFHGIINNKNYAEGSCFVLESDKSIVGFIATQIMPNHIASIPILIYKDPDTCNQLLQSTTEYLRSNNVAKIQVGGGGQTYFWPGIPTNLLKLAELFSQNKFEYSETSVDLTQDLTSYSTPKNMLENIKKQGIKFSILEESEKDILLNFEKINFPEWFEFYADKLQLGEYSDILVAQNSNNEILGAVILSTKNSISKANFWLWRKLLGDDSGAFGALGIRKDMRGKGIGLALAARATEILKERGVIICYLGWTWLIDWYGKLGYSIWREYQMSWKELC